MFERKPCVYLVGSDYQIVFSADCHGIAWVEAGGRIFPDEQNGLMRSETLVHRAVVPSQVLDEAKKYAVCFRALPERKPYWPKLGETQRAEYAFRPIDWSDGLQICHVADAHSHVEETVEAGRQAGSRMDLLVMNGDIPAESKKEEDILAVLDIAAGITGGERPVVYARGNHDTRGRLALELTDFIGTDEGRTYFTFRSGALWGIVLDCGEDKLDSSEEYGGLVSCHRFRQRQTEFLKRVIADRAREFEAPGVSIRLAVCHVPFPTALLDDNVKFDIEQEIYADWTRLLNEMGLDLMLCGHMHALSALLPGDSRMRYGANFPVLVGSEPLFSREHPEQNRFTGALIEADGEQLRADYADNLGTRREALRISRKQAGE